MSRWFLWKRGSRGPTAQIIYGGTNKPMMLKEDIKQMIGDITLIAPEHEELLLKELAKIYPCPQDNSGE